MGITLLMGDLLAITCDWHKDRKYFEHMFIITPFFSMIRWMHEVKTEKIKKQTTGEALTGCCLAEVARPGIEPESKV